MAGHGSPPAEDKANHPNRKVGRYMMGEGFGGVNAEYEALGNVSDEWSGISTQPKSMSLGKYRAEPNVVQRVRRARPDGTQHPRP